MGTRTPPGFWMVDPSFVNSSSAQSLAQVLNVSKHESAMYIALFYAWAAKIHIDVEGDISSFNARGIEEACLWEGNRKDLCRAFVSAGIIDGSFDDEDADRFIVDWVDVAANIFESRKDAAARAKAYRERRKAEHEAALAALESITNNVTRDVTPPRYEIENKTENEIQNNNKKTELRAEKTEPDSREPSPPTHSNDNFDLNGNKGIYKRYQNAVQYARENIAVFTDRNEKDIADFVFFKGIYPGLVEYAVDEACGNGMRDTWDYCHKILQAYAENGIKTLEQAWERERQYQANKKTKDKPTPKVRFLT